ncbi:MAG TPA: hypothetical protein VNK52_04000 [Hyphomicrobiaceae bacterium]|nr:hypothetical protein [Hyphomicrobiaceae bacterium]
MKITPTDHGYILETSQGGSVTLSDQELAELVRDGHRLLNPRARFRPVATMNIENATLGIDAHHTQAVLILIHDGGAETAFAIPGTAVRKLAEAFAAKAASIEAARSMKTEH